MKKLLLVLLVMVAISCTETELLTPPSTDPIELKDVDIQSRSRTVGSGCTSAGHNTMNDTCTRECQPKQNGCDHCIICYSGDYWQCSHCYSIDDEED